MHSMILSNKTENSLYDKPNANIVYLKYHKLQYPHTSTPNLNG